MTTLTSAVILASLLAVSVNAEPAAGLIKVTTEAVQKTVTLTKPYPASYKDAPTDKISVQYAAIELCRQAGLQYNWEASFKNTDPVCRKWVYPEIRNKTFRDAMKALLGPVGLTYELREKAVVLKKP